MQSIKAVAAVSLLFAALVLLMVRDNGGGEVGTINAEQQSFDEPDELEFLHEAASPSSTSERAQRSSEREPDGSTIIAGCREETEKSKVRECLLEAFSSQRLEQAAQALASVVCLDEQRSVFMMECVYACIKAFPPEEAVVLIQLTAGYCPDQRRVGRIADAIAKICEFDRELILRVFASGEPETLFVNSPGAVSVRVLGAIAEVTEEKYLVSLLRRGATGAYGGSEGDIEMSLMMSHALCDDAADKMLLAKEVLLSQHLLGQDAYIVGTTLMDMLARGTTTRGVEPTAVEEEVLAAIGHPTLGRGAARQLLYAYRNGQTPEWTTDERWPNIRGYAELIAKE